MISSDPYSDLNLRVDLATFRQNQSDKNLVDLISQLLLLTKVSVVGGDTKSTGERYSRSATKVTTPGRAWLLFAEYIKAGIEEKIFLESSRK